MASTRVVVRNKYGLHAKPAAMFVQLANQFKSDVYVNKNGVEVNGKSIMSVMMLAVERGTEITIRCIGEDEKEALEALKKLVDSGFDEE